MAYSKYNAKKVEFNGIKFDSENEKDYYIVLLKRANQGQISNLKVHPSYELQEPFELEGIKHSAITYEADFEYYDYFKRQLVVVDIKGVKTPEFLIKYKLFEHKHNQHLTILKRVGEEWIEDSVLKEKKKTKRQELIAEKNKYKKLYEMQKELDELKKVQEPTKRQLNRIATLERKLCEDDN